VVDLCVALDLGWFERILRWDSHSESIHGTVPIGSFFWFDYNVESGNIALVLEFQFGIAGNINRSELFLEPDQSWSCLISGGGDDTIRVWDLRSMKQVKNISLKSFTNMEITVDGKYLVTSGGKDVSFWDLQKFDKSKDFSLTVDVSSASLSPDGSTLVVGSTDLTVRTYEYGSGKELEILKGHHGPVHCVAFAPDGASFASGSEDGTIRLWQSGEPRAYGLWQENKSSSEGTKT